MFIFIMMVLVATLVAVAAVAISLITFLRKRLWVRSLTEFTEFTDLIVCMVHQFRNDETNRQYKFEQEQKVLKVQAQEASIARTLRVMDGMQQLMVEEFDSSN